MARLPFISFYYNFIVAQKMPIKTYKRNYVLTTLEIIQTLEMKIFETFSKTHLCVEDFDIQKGLYRKALGMKIF